MPTSPDFLFVPALLFSPSLILFGCMAPKRLKTTALELFSPPHTHSISSSSLLHFFSTQGVSRQREVGTSPNFCLKRQVQLASWRSRTSIQAVRFRGFPALLSSPCSANRQIFTHAKLFQESHKFDAIQIMRSGGKRESRRSQETVDLADGLRGAAQTLKVALVTRWPQTAEGSGKQSIQLCHCCCSHRSHFQELRLRGCQKEELICSPPSKKSRLCLGQKKCFFTNRRCWKLEFKFTHTKGWFKPSPQPHHGTRETNVAT